MTQAICCTRDACAISNIWYVYIYIYNTYIYMYTMSNEPSIPKKHHNFSTSTSAEKALSYDQKIPAHHENTISPAKIDVPMELSIPWKHLTSCAFKSTKRALCSTERALHTMKTPYLPRKRGCLCLTPPLIQKSPVFYQKSPMFYQKCPPHHETPISLAETRLFVSDT